MSVIILILSLIVAMGLAFTLGVKLTIHTVNKSYVGTMHVINIRDDPETHIFTEYVKSPDEFRTRRFILMNIKNRDDRI